MTQQTAVEWLIDKIKKDSNIRLRGLNFDELEEQAKQMEKEQHRRTWDEGVNEYSTYYHTFEQYYNKTYGKE